jgi:hypothetical protein
MKPLKYVINLKLKLILYTNLYSKNYIKESTTYIRVIKLLYTITVKSIYANLILLGYFNTNC